MHPHLLTIGVQFHSPSSPYRCPIAFSTLPLLMFNCTIHTSLLISNCTLYPFPIYVHSTLFPLPIKNSIAIPSRLCWSIIPYFPYPCWWLIPLSTLSFLISNHTLCPPLSMSKVPSPLLHFRCRLLPLLMTLNTTLLHINSELLLPTTLKY